MNRVHQGQLEWRTENSAERGRLTGAREIAAVVFRAWVNASGVKKHVAPMRRALPPVRRYGADTLVTGRHLDAALAM